VKARVFILQKTHALISRAFMLSDLLCLATVGVMCFWCVASAAHFLLFGGVIMDQQKIQLFLVSNQKNFEASQLPIITEKLEQLDDEKYMIVSAANYKEPTTMLLISLFLGGLGVDRFVLGDTGMGVLKLLTGGCFGILTIIDWFTIASKTKQYNFNVFMNSINDTQILTSASNNLSSNSNTVAEIKKYKELLDSGIITQEEFDSKKSKLLNS
jgi:TM2 domain-containing membrane protein YozV